MDTIKNFKFIVIFLYFTSFGFVAPGQTYFGFKVGASASKAYFENEVYNRFYKSEIKPGFSAGAVFLMQNKGRYGLYTEFLYSVRGKNVQSRANDYENNKATYTYLDMPVMFRVKFDRPQYDWFLQVGPEINYWLGGKGTFRVYEPDRDVYTTYKYTINLGERKNGFEYLNVEQANQLQLGLAFGGGLIWDLKNANYISLDVRFTLGHTYMGEFEGASIPNIGLVDNFEHTNSSLSISAVYYFDILEKLRLSKNKYHKRK